MADIIGILAFALHATHKIYNIVESIKDAPNEIQALRDDALRVRGFLQELLNSPNEDRRVRQVNPGDLPDQQTEALVKHARGITAIADTFIAKATIPRNDGTYEVRKLKWPFYACQAKKLSKQFRSFYQSLTAVFTVSTS